MARGLILLSFLASACVRTGEQRRPVLPTDGTRDRAPSDLSAFDRLCDLPSGERARDAHADRSGDARAHDAAQRSQELGILVTADDGEITGGLLLPSGETWHGNLIHAGSWATAASGGPVMTYAYLRFRLTLPLAAGAAIASATLEVYGHALTGGSQWSPQKHKLVISADRSADAAQVASPVACPGCSKGAVQTASVDWSSIVWTPDAWNTTPNLAAIVQELVDAHGGLKAGAHLQLWLRAPIIYPEDAEVPFEDLDHAGGKAARLTLSWLEP
jgi:hypothetical protein